MRDPPLFTINSQRKHRRNNNTNISFYQDYFDLSQNQVLKAEAVLTRFQDGLIMKLML